MNDRFWDIFNRNMRTGIHRTNGESRARDVNEFIYWLLERKYTTGLLLNVGIGDCQEALIFKQNGYDVFGISNSQDEVDNAHKLGICAACMDAHQLTLDDDMFDYIYLHDTMEHFIAPIMVFTQCRRVLKMGGILGFHYPTISDSHNWTHWFIESPRLIFDWLLKFGFRLLMFKYEPGASSEFLYIAKKEEISQEEFEIGGNVIEDMIRELKEYKNG